MTQSKMAYFYEPSEQASNDPVLVESRAVTVRLSRGFHALVDEEDFDRVNQFRWTACWSKSTYYAKGNVDGKQTLLHRFILGDKAGRVVDHRNGNGLDCRRSNLRPCTASQNGQNRALTRRRMRGLKYKGVAHSRSRRRFVASITKDGKHYCVGSFGTEVEAARAYDLAARELFGEFARLNFPDEGPIRTANPLRQTAPGGPKGGRPLKCTCGECQTCNRRARRNRRRDEKLQTAG